MSQNQTFNGTVYQIPTQGDLRWAASLDRYLVALGTYALAPSGGNFTLTANVNFGASFGLLSAYFSGRGSVADAGLLRLSKTDVINWKNNAGSGNNTLATDSSDNLTYNGVAVPTGLSTLMDGQIWIGSSSNLPVAQTLTGDVTVTNAGVTAIGAGKIVNAQVSNTAAIAYSKLNLSGSILNSDIFATAAIAYSKLSLTGSILNADINASAAIAVSKLAALTASSNVRSDASGFLTTGAVDLSTADVTGNLGVTHLNSGTSASNTTFWRGDGTWATPSGSGTVNSGTAGNLGLYATSTTAISDTYVQNTKNITVGIASQGSRSANLALTIPNPGNAVTAANFLLSEGAQTINGNQTFAGTNNYSGLTASTALALDGSKNVVSVTNTGSGNNVLATNPTLAGATLTSTIAMGSNKITGLANGTTSTDAVAFGQIKVLQYVQATASTATTTSSSTFAACTNQSVSITPTSSSNRVKISVSTPVSVASSATQGSITLKRGSTELSGVTQGFAIADYATNGALGTLSFNYIDSPATTSSTTYQVFVRSSNNSSNVTCGRSDVLSVIIAEEIV